MELDLGGPLMALPHFGCKDSVRGRGEYSWAPGTEVVFGGGGGLVLQLQHLVHWSHLDRPPMQGLSDSEYQGRGACRGLGDSQGWHWPDGGTAHHSWRQQGTVVKSQWV